MTSPTTDLAQEEMFRATARFTDPQSSHDAAAIAEADLSRACSEVLAALRRLGPSSDEALQTFYDQYRKHYSWRAQRCVRKRRKDLVVMKLVRPTGRRVENPVGILVREWEAV